MLAGDAVHQLSPTGAMGMNTGIADAVDLSWKLAGVLQGWGGPNLTASYEAERQPIGWRNVSMATKFYESHLEFDQGLSAIEDATPEGEAVRADAGPKMTDQVAKMFRTDGLQIGFRYDNSPICIEDGTPEIPDDPEHFAPSARPGARAPHVWMDEGRSTLDLFGKGFTLLRLGPDAAEGDMLAKAAENIGAPFFSHAIADQDVAGIYGAKYVLVRPDGHVAWRGDQMPGDCDALMRTVCGW